MFHLMIFSKNAYSDMAGLNHATRPTLSQFWSFEIHRTTFVKFIKFADFLIARLLNCERACRERTCMVRLPSRVRPPVRLILACQIGLLFFASFSSLFLTWLTRSKRRTIDALPLFQNFISTHHFFILLAREGSKSRRL